MAMTRAWTLSSLLLAVACAGALPAASPSAQPLTQDPDRQPFQPKPEPYVSPLIWDGANHIFFRPLARLFAVDPGGEAANVNALDEVADSSWFTNRIGQRPLSPEEVASGPCTTAPLDPAGPWQVIASKDEGATPGFIVRATDGLRYLIKFDDAVQSPRPTAADAIGSRIFYAAGFSVPCNRVVFFERSVLKLAPGATLTTWTGQKEALTDAHLDMLLTHATRLSDGRYRASSSRWLSGDSLGPWRYEGTRGDDPNDVVDHEDRRELRGARLLAAWLDHLDSREENTLATWMPAGDGSGWVRHAFIDFSDCFGDVWDPPALGRAAGHEYLVDPVAIAGDLLTLGIPHPRWQSARFGASGAVFGYYDIERFEPEAWRPYYPVPAFDRMTERDGAWMARIVAHFGREHLERAIRAGRMGSRLNAELLRILEGRREKILRRYLARLSPLSEPRLQQTGTKTELCVRDLAVLAGMRASTTAGPSATLERADGATLSLRVEHASDSEACVELPPAPASARGPVGSRLAMTTATRGEGRVIVHLYERSPLRYSIVGLERQR
jgi:hypothetical protein